MLIYLKESQRKGTGRKEERESYICCFTPQIVIMVRAGSGGSRSFFQVSYTVARAQVLGPSYAASQGPLATGVVSAVGNLLDTSVAGTASTTQLLLPKIMLLHVAFYSHGSSFFKMC